MMAHLTSMSPEAAIIGLAALTLSVAGASFLAYDFSIGRRRLATRIDALCRSRTPTNLETAVVPSRRAVPPVWLSLSKVPEGDELELARRLQKFPWASSHALALLYALRLTASVVTAAVLVVLTYWYRDTAQLALVVLIAAAGGGLGWFVPHLVFDRLIKKRMRSIERGLPDAIELLVIAVEAGLALEDGIDRIIGELRRSQPVLAEELALTSADLKILPSRDAALHRLSERVDLPSLHSVVTTLTQTMRYGTPLAQALRVVAAELRGDALIRLEERAGKMPALLTVPMVVFILPSIFLVIGGPAFLRLMDTFFH